MMKTPAANGRSFKDKCIECLLNVERARAMRVDLLGNYITAENWALFFFFKFSNHY